VPVSVPDVQFAHQPAHGLLVQRNAAERYNGQDDRQRQHGEEQQLGRDAAQ
jgi:hypothetical protein